MAEVIMIHMAPSLYQPALKKGDAKGNSNQKIDSPQEAFAAAEEYCQQTQERECQKFMDYLENKGYSLYAYKKSRTQKVITLNNDGISFPEGYLPREGAKIVITGKRNAYINWGNGKLKIDEPGRAQEVMFVFDGSGSMRHRFPGSGVNKFTDLKHAIISIIDFLPSDLRYKLNIFGPDDTARGEKPKLNLEVAGGDSQAIKQALNLKPDQIKGATHLWANLEYSVKNTRDGGIVILYSDGASDIFPTGKGPEEADKKARMRSITEYIEKHKIEIYIACGSDEALTHLKEFAALSSRFHLSVTLEPKTIQSFFKKEVKDAVLQPEPAHYKIYIRDSKGKLLGVETVGATPDPQQLLFKQTVLKAKAGKVGFEADDQIKIEDLKYTDSKGRVRSINLADYVPVGKAELQYDNVVINVPPLPHMSMSRVVSLVLDRSTSMDGRPLEQLKEASLKFVSGLVLASFSVNEFKDNNALNALFYRVDADLDYLFTKQAKAKFPDLKFDPKIQTDLLNLVLRIPNLFPILYKKSIINQRNISRELASQINAASDLFKKDFDDMTPKERIQIINLNRKLLETSYSKLCPQKNAYQFSVNFFPDPNRSEEDNIIELSPTSDIKEIKRVINQAAVTGSTPAWQNIMRSLVATPAYGSLVVFSDGDFNSQPSHEFIQNILRIAIAKQVKIYFIGLGSMFDNVKESSEPGDDKGYMKYITHRTTGDDRAYIHVAKVDTLARAFQNVKEQIEQSRLVVEPPKPTAVRVPVRKGKQEFILEIELAPRRPQADPSKAAALPVQNDFQDALAPGATYKQVTRHSNGQVASGVLTIPVEIHNFNLPVGTRVLFDTNGRVNGIVLQEDQKIGVFSTKFLAGKKISLNSRGKIESAYLAEELEGQGETPSGEKFEIKFKQYSLIKFIDYDRGVMCGGILAENITINGITYKAGTWNETHESNDDFDRVKMGTLAKPTTINGKRYEAGTTIWLSPSGQVQKSKK